MLLHYHRLASKVVAAFVVFFCCMEVSGQERAIDHAPIGVMGDHYHGKGEWMISARHMKMLMSGNRDGRQDLSDMDIIGLPNPYQMGSMSTHLSVVPQEMSMDMTMLGAMYAPSDMVTLMFMGMFVNKTMDLVTYSGIMPNSGMMRRMSGMGSMNRTNLGSFSTQTRGFADLSVSGLIRLYEGDVSRVHAQLGVQQSLGSSDTSGEVLTPMNMRRTMILPYGMQLGDGSTSALLALTYVADLDRQVYGMQIRSRNSISLRSWNFGNSMSLTGWAQQEVVEKTSLSFRATYYKQNPITGRNASIMAPIQTANPANYGGTRTEISVGLNQLVFALPGNHADRIGIELSYPVLQDLNGPQMKRGFALQVGYQKSL